MKKEIERKFIVHHIPEVLIPFEEKVVHQNYLSKTLNEEVRIRLQEENGQRSFDLSYKKGKGISRAQTQVNIGEALYYDLSNKIAEMPLMKKRKFFKVNGQDVMVDEYLGLQRKLMVAEVEFASEQEAEEFQVPEWFGEDVTYDEKYKNKILWKELQQEMVLNV